MLRAIAREADGSGRDALTLLDRLTSALGKTLALEDSIAILDLVDRKLLADVLDPVLAHDPARALVALRRVLEQGIDPVRLAGDLLAELRDLVVARLVEDPTGLIDAAPDAIDELRARAKPHDPETLQRLFRVLLTRIQELAFASRQEHALEMAVLRLATLPEAEALATLVRKLETLEGGGRRRWPGWRSAGWRLGRARPDARRARADPRAAEGFVRSRLQRRHPPRPLQLPAIPTPAAPEPVVRRSAERRSAAPRRRRVPLRRERRGRAGGQRAAGRALCAQPRAALEARGADAHRGEGAPARARGDRRPRRGAARDPGRFARAQRAPDGRRMSQPPFDLRAVMAQAQEMGEKLRRVQEELRHRTVSATVGGGMVEVTANGALEIVKVVIDPQAVDPRDVEMLQDLVRAAANQALARAREMAAAAMQQVAGIPLPPGFGPGLGSGGGGA